MGISLEMVTDRSISLNFLIFLQNIYLNQNRDEERLRFPYSSTKIAFKEKILSEYKELWNVVSAKVSLNDGTDLEVFHEEKELFYQKLFSDNAGSLTSFNEVYKGFQVWWESFAGGIAVERSIDELGHSLYLDLVRFLKERRIVPQKPLYIWLIYDECLLANSQVSSYHAVIPVGDYYLKYKELVLRLQNCFI
ncbi:hypothetical protein [Cytobacillus purgationiresistens]|uniref:Uncharacterized protein n=1 Tax=Cytobacillus purgationiresistens TaxID=863449 RepID=A0ABU0ART0_9BACI|nr:hypothetical protein [Cytobacillus purgationiresistens]MDQ0273976.1 hypothetical protein [Cytobacillus purgationiresistens]